MRSPIFIALGFGFMLMGAGLYALTLRGAKDASAPAHPTKAQLREQAVLAAETRKMRIAAGVIVLFGACICLMFFS